MSKTLGQMARGHEGRAGDPCKDDSEITRLGERRVVGARSLLRLVCRALSRARWFCWGLFVIGVGLVFRMPSETGDAAGKKVRRILVVSLGGIGDLVLNTPVLRELRKGRPHAMITLLIPERGRDIYETCPYVDKLLVVDSTLEKRRNPLQSLRSARAYWRTEEKHKFDIALSPRVGLDPFLAFMLYFSASPLRLGYSECFTGDLGHWARFTAKHLNLDRLLTRTILVAKPQHEILNSLAILEALGIKPSDPSPEVWLRPCDREFAARACRGETANSDGMQFVVGMGVGAGGPKRIWPLERQAAIAAWLIATYDARIILLGGPDEAQAASMLAAQIGPAAISLAGHTSLRQTAAVVEACSILLVHDSGLLHIGSAVRTPIVEISCHPKSGSPSHSNAPERFGPWHVPHRILRPEHPRPPCVDGCCVERQAHCILEIGTEAVQEALSELIGEQYGRKPNR